MTISEMRLYLMSKYPNKMHWHERVQKMPTRQVIAIYNNMTRRSKKADDNTNYHYHQIDMFEYIASLTQNNTEVNV